MAFTDSRTRTGYLLLTVVVGHVLLISAQVNSKTGVPILEAVGLGIFAQVQRAMTAAAGGVRGMWDGYLGLRHVQAENQELQRRLADTQVQLQQQRALADRSRGLERLLMLRDRTALQTTGAEIIGAGVTPDFRTVTIDKGEREGLKPDMAVIAPAGAVGRVVVTSSRASKVQLLIDRNAAAGALVERSRAQGVVVGSGNEQLRMDYVSEVSDVVVGDSVVTSGIDGIYPKGFAIGRVDAVEKAGGSYRRILVRPAVDFSSLEEVLVVLTPSPVSEAPVTPSPASDAPEQR
jgi:rod shape-determining protein MreC